MKYDISVLCPGIRIPNWKKLYLSCQDAFSGSWEFVLITPYELPEELKEYDNIKVINDWGTPIRCQQRGLIESEGDFITWAADDGHYTPGSLDKSFALLKDLDYKNVVTGTYSEGYNPENIENMKKWEYYNLKFHNSTNHPYIPDDALILNVGLIPRKLLGEVGGWDAETFEVCPMAYSDLSIRFNHLGVNFIKQEGVMFVCGHMPGHEGDHGPIHDAQVFFDEPKMRKMYSDKVSEARINIDLDNWKKSPERWERRFGKQ
jgi:hypothetical protein